MAGKVTAGQAATRDGQGRTRGSAQMGDGQGSARNGQRATLPVCAFDWSHKDVCYTLDGTVVLKVKDLRELIDVLAEPHLILGEATYESFRLDRRQEFRERCDELGHDLREISPRATEIERKRAGIKKDDADDTRVLFSLATNGRTHLKRPSPIPDNDYLLRFEEARMELMRARYTNGYGPYEEEFIALFPDLDDLADDHAVRLLATGKSGISGMAVATVLVCARWARGRREFDRMLGMYLNGYPSLMRSNLVFHRYSMVGWGDKRRIVGREPQVKANVLRRGARQIFARYAAAGKRQPATCRIVPQRGSA